MKITFHCKFDLVLNNSMNFCLIFQSNHVLVAFKLFVSNLCTNIFDIKTKIIIIITYKKMKFTDDKISNYEHSFTFVNNR